MNLLWLTPAFHLLQIMKLGGRDVRKKLAKLQLGRNDWAVFKSPECSRLELAKTFITNSINNLMPLQLLSSRKSTPLCFQSLRCFAVTGRQLRGVAFRLQPESVFYSHRPWCGWMSKWHRIVSAPWLGSWSILSMKIIINILLRYTNRSCRCLTFLKPGIL